MWQQYEFSFDKASELPDKYRNGDGAHLRRLSIFLDGPALAHVSPQSSCCSMNTFPQTIVACADAASSTEAVY